MNELRAFLSLRMVKDLKYLSIYLTNVCTVWVYIEVMVSLVKSKQNA